MRLTTFNHPNYGANEARRWARAGRFEHSSCFLLTRERKVKKLPDYTIVNVGRQDERETEENNEGRAQGTRGKPSE